MLTGVDVSGLKLFVRSCSGVESEQQRLTPDRFIFLHLHALVIFLWFWQKQVSRDGTIEFQQGKCG